MKKFIPIIFARFNPPLEFLISRNPTGIALAGSYGNPNKSPDPFSDLDILFVFDTDRLLLLVQEFMTYISNLPGLLNLYLGIHPQFGHLFNLFFPDNPLQWVDIGIMDENFARNYLTGLPITVVRGIVKTSNIPPNPSTRMAHLGKKILKAHQRNDVRLKLIYSYRYVQWSQIEIGQQDSPTTVIERVLDDIRRKFPYLIRWNNLNQTAERTR